MKVHHWGLAGGVMALFCMSTVSAQGVLDRIASGSTLVIAHRESSVPFSYIDSRSGKPVGYAMDLCMHLAQVIRRRTGLKHMQVKLLAVSSANRMAAIEQGNADMECGSTTNNAERRKTVAFTVPHFITGARLLVKRDSAINGMEDLNGKRLVSTKGTIPWKLADKANRDHLLGITLLEAPDHGQAVEMVEKGEADAFAMDDVLLYGLAAGRPNPAAFKVVGRFITTEPLAIMLPKNDPVFKELIDEEMRRLINSRDIYPIYDKWFAKPIPPNNTVLNLPVSYLLRDFWKYPTDQVPF